MRLFSLLLKCVATSLFVFSLAAPGAPKPPPKAPASLKTKFETLSLRKTSKRCNPSYRIEVNALNVVETTPPALKPLVEAQLQTWLRENLGAETSAATTPEAWLNEELARYEKECETDEKNAQPPWERVLSVKHFFEDENWLSLRLSVSGSEGGAHANDYTQFVSWNKKTLAPLSLAALSPEAQPLLQLAEAEFRKARKLKPDDDFEANGYWFDRGEFRLSREATFTECGLMLYYNPYEVAAYAVGPISVFIPFPKLKTLSQLQLPSKTSVKAFEKCPTSVAPPSSASKPSLKVPAKK